MTKQEFLGLTLSQQAEIVFSHGKELLHRIFSDYLIKLYQVSDFYVEIWYLPAFNKIDNILVVDLENVFHLYEKEIDISDLFASQ